MQFISVDEARRKTGVRLVVAKGWGIWSECAKNIFYFKKIPYAPIAQLSFQPNTELVAWTGVRNQPQLIYNDEPVITSWLDILNFSERHTPTPPLLPQDSSDRALVIGLSNELLGEKGLGWSRRVQLNAPSVKLAPEAEILLSKEYPGDPDVRAAIQRQMDIVAMMGTRLQNQRKAGSRYFVGSNLTALDIYWATFSNLLRVLPEDLCPMDINIRAMLDNPGPEIDAVTDPILFEHRNYIYETYLQLPVDLDDEHVEAVKAR